MPTFTTIKPKPVQLLSMLGILTVSYTVLILGYVATSPDLRIRTLILSSQNALTPQPGVIIQLADGFECYGVQPEQDARLLRVRNQSIATSLEFNRELRELRSAVILKDGILDPNVNPAEVEYLPPLVEESGRRWVRLEFLQPGSNRVESCWVLIQTLPFDELILSFISFLLQLALLGVGALVYWHRSFDRSARLFFAMSIVTLGAFTAGYHWWVIASSIWLLIPFICYACLVPVVTLHFFMVYPRPHPWLKSHPELTGIGLYLVPAVAILSFSWLVLYLHAQPSGSTAFEAVSESLRSLRWGISAYLNLAGLYFLLTLGRLIRSYTTVQNPIEHSQLKWILAAGIFALFPVGYSLYMAQWGDRGRFALGETGMPMFLASLGFMLAYAIGMIRYRLMLVDQIISKGVLYYTASFLATLGFSLAFVVAIRLAETNFLRQTPLHLVAWFGFMMLVVLVLLFFRDRIQQAIDRTYYREKYQLDKALQRMNRAVRHFVDQESIAELLLGSCRDVLGVDQAALYLRVYPEGNFQLATAHWSGDLPLQLTPDPLLLKSLSEYHSLQKSVTTNRGDMSATQKLLHDLQADFVQSLETEQAINGLLLLGQKRSGNPFTAEDLTFLNAMCQFTTVALHSAKVHQDLSRLNEEMQIKVERITSQQRQIELLQHELTAVQEPGRSVASERDGFHREEIRGNSPALQRVLETVRKVARSESTVLIRGESGTGKELLARTLHGNSSRSDGPLISVHCASLSPSLLESELFGHVKGAFTGAYEDKPGRFQAANGGTLFLDEIGDISLETQIKLLRVLQERCFEPVGSSQTISVDVRLITATHQNLEKLIREGRFREDLFYRLNVISISLPPLRDRREDLLELTMYFLSQAAKKTGRPIPHIDEQALNLMERYHWPGNIRELQNIIERAVVLAENNRITLGELPVELMRAPARNAEPQSAPVRSAMPVPPVPSSGRPAPSAPQSRQPASSDSAALPRQPALSSPARLSLDNFFLTEEEERRQLLSALEKCQGNKAEAARLLGLPRSTYFSKLKRHGLL